MSSKVVVLTSLVVVAVMMAGCQSKVAAPQTNQQEAPAKIAPNQKQGETSKTGTISKAGTQFFINQTGQAPLAIDSYTVDLEQYVGQSVTVTGQYSGDTLFVGEIK